MSYFIKFKKEGSYFGLKIVQMWYHILLYYDSIFVWNLMNWKLLYKSYQVEKNKC